MATFKNTSVGVMNFAGTIVAPGQTFDANESHPGIKRMLDRKVLEKVDGRTKSTKAEPKQEAKAEDSKSSKAE